MILNRAKLHSLSFAMFYHSVEKYLFYSGEMQTLHQQINEASKKNRGCGGGGKVDVKTF